MKNEINPTTWKFECLIHIVMRLISATTLALVLVVVASCEPGVNWRTLSGDEVQALFSGKTEPFREEDQDGS